MKVPSLAAVLALAIASGACTPKRIYLLVDPRPGVARVELRAPAGLVAREEVPLLLTDCGFWELPPEDAPSGLPAREIWRVTSLSPDGAVFAVEYGRVPPGFTQVSPAAGPPPPLAPGTRYLVECSGDAMGLTEFVYGADAAGAPAAK